MSPISPFLRSYHATRFRPTPGSVIPSTSSCDTIVVTLSNDADAGLHPRLPSSYGTTAKYAVLEPYAMVSWYAQKLLVEFPNGVEITWPDRKKITYIRLVVGL